MSKEYKELMFCCTNSNCSEYIKENKDWFWTESGYAEPPKCPKCDTFCSYISEPIRSRISIIVK